MTPRTQPTGTERTEPPRGSGAGARHRPSVLLWLVLAACLVGNLMASLVDVGAAHVALRVLTAAGGTAVVVLLLRRRR